MEGASLISPTKLFCATVFVHVWENVVTSTCSKTICQSFLSVLASETYSTGRNSLSPRRMLGIRLVLYIGHNTLDTKLKTMIQLGGLKTENRSNHSLRATAITRMQEEKFPENIIMEQSGHLSKEGVHSYEKTSESQKKEVSDILSDITRSSTVNSAAVTSVTPVSHLMPWDADSLDWITCSRTFLMSVLSCSIHHMP